MFKLKVERCLFRLVNPCLLYGFENFFTATGGIVIEIGQGENQVAQMGKADGFRVDVAVGVVKFFGNALGVCPFHNVFLCCVEAV